MNRSEAECLLDLELAGAGAPRLSRAEAYRACAGLAVHGQRHAAESELDPADIALLEARRGLFRGEDEQVRSQLLTLKVSGNSYQEGDRLFLLGWTHNRAGEFRESAELWSRSAAQHGSLGDERRALRALINARISVDPLESYLSGALHALEQRAASAGFDELAGNVAKARATELLSRGRFLEAAAEANLAVQRYESGGMAEDRSIALLTSALAHVAVGDLEEASRLYHLNHLQTARIAPFQAAYAALCKGLKPNLDPSHTLAGTPWPIRDLRRESIPSKILRTLQVGPRTIDEIIVSVWGEGAVHPSYRNRLHNAMNGLRKRQEARIAFDGERYRLG